MCCPFCAAVIELEVVARRYSVSREAQDAFGAESHRRAVEATAAGLFADEIAPLPSRMVVTDKATGETSFREVTLTEDEGMRPGTTPPIARRLAARL
jgi:acetyl-CoA C-acetyltransferase